MNLFEKLTIAGLAITTGVFATATGIAHKANKDLKAEDVNINTRIDDLQTQIDNINKQIKALEEKEANDIAEVKADYNSKIELLQNAILAVNQSVDELSLHVEDINEAVNERIDDVIANLNSAIKALEKADVDNKTELTSKIVELKTLVEQYKTALEQADTNLANTLLQKIATEKETLTLLIGDKVSTLETTMNTKVAEIKADYEKKIKALKDELAELTDDTDSRLDAIETAINSLDTLGKDWQFLATPLQVKYNSAEDYICAIRYNENEIQYYMRAEHNGKYMFYVDNSYLDVCGPYGAIQGTDTTVNRHPAPCGVYVNWYNKTYSEYQTTTMSTYFIWNTAYTINSLNALNYTNGPVYWSTDSNAYLTNKNFAETDLITFAEDIRIADGYTITNLLVHASGRYMKPISKESTLDNETGGYYYRKLNDSSETQLKLNSGYYIVSGKITWGSWNNNWYIEVTDYSTVNLSTLLAM